MIEVKHLTKEFRSGDSRIKAVNDISFTIPPGAFTAIVGKSGSGKSTLLALLGALDKPTLGTIKVGDQEITKLSDRRLIGYRRQKIGFVFQHYNLIPNLTALENVMLPMEFAGLPTGKRKARAAQLLDQVGLDAQKQSRKPGRLSGGEGQRVAIARALANEPELILADEPTGNLDSTTSKIIVELLKNLSKSHTTTIIVVTHDLNITRHTDLTYQLKDGSLIKHNGHIKKLVS